MSAIIDYSSYKISSGTVLIAHVTIEEIAHILHLRKNSRKLSKLFEGVRLDQRKYDCVHAIHVLLKSEFARVGLKFQWDSVELVRDVFWLAYANIDDSINVIGEPARAERLVKSANARDRLANRLVGRPLRGRFVYPSSSGAARTAFDRAALVRSKYDPDAVIDLEALAHLVHAQLDRPLLTLVLKDV